MISLKNIVKTYSIEGASIEVLKQVSLHIAKGELLAIVGASGSGKSTMMNIIGLLDKADKGEYWLNGHNVDSLNEDARASLRNQQIGFVFQHFNLLARCNVLQNVALPLTYRSTCAISITEKEDRVQSALARVGMQAFAKHRPSQLSGGQQQRVAIARALVGDPTILLADEPTGSLDSRTGSEVLHLFLELHAEGRTIIMVTHDEKVAKLAQSRITMADGQIVQRTNSSTASGAIANGLKQT